RSTHAAPHSVRPGVQLHTPPLHEVPPTQAFPHAPQSRLSQQVATQPPLHATSPAGQDFWQVPPAHTSAGGQADLHFPQWSALDCKSTHEPEQATVPPGHTHAPAAQNEPPVHCTPQPPQSLVLELVSTQLPPHWVWPGAQLDWHLPL